MQYFEQCSMVVYAAISIVSMIIGYTFSVSTIIKLGEEITELQVQILEILNRERLLIDEYRDFVQDTKAMNKHMANFIDNLQQ